MTSSNNATLINFKNRIKYLLGSLCGKRMSSILYTVLTFDILKYVVYFEIQYHPIIIINLYSRGTVNRVGILRDAAIAEAIFMK